MKDNQTKESLEEVQAATRSIETKLEFERRKLSNYNEIQDNIDALTKRLNNCFELFASSMSGPVVDEQLEDMQNANITFHKNAKNYLEATISDTNKNITAYNTEKEELQKKAREISDKDSKEE